MAASRGLRYSELILTGKTIVFFCEISPRVLNNMGKLMPFVLGAIKMSFWVISDRQQKLIDRLED